MNGLALSILVAFKLLLNPLPGMDSIPDGQFVPNKFDSPANSGFLQSLLPDSALYYFESVSLDDIIQDSVVNEATRNHQLLSEYIIPCNGKIISHFGIRRGRMHTGTDIKLNLGDTIIASCSGIVSRASGYYGYGRLVVIDHLNNTETWYGHLSSYLVNKGDTIGTAQPIGLGGRTGRATTEHLHFEIRENGIAYNTELVFDYEKRTVRPEILNGSSLAELTGKLKNEMKGGIFYSPSEYIIRAGDSLWIIARRFGTTVAELCRLNQLTPAAVLKIGRALKISESGN